MITEGVEGIGRISRRSCWLVGVSGGADSVALLHLLVGQGFTKLIVCHLDHRLRGRAAVEDAKFVKRLAARLGLVCEVGRADVAGRMRECGESMETAARHARHAFFVDCAEKYRCPRVLLAHHADDQAETVLWNLVRGSRGLKGMRERQVMSLFGKRMIIGRPLLKVGGRELREWLVARDLRWREDASNAELTIVRNRLRHEVLPLLDEISGRGVARMIGRALEGSGELAEIESWAVARAGVLDPQGRLHLPAMRALPCALQRAVIVDFLKQAGIGGIDRALVARVVALLDVGAAPAVNLPGGASIRRRGGRLLIEAAAGKRVGD